MKRYALLLLLLTGCATPTMAQREANWHKFQDATRATCLVGRVDPSMPGDVRFWCVEVLAP
jgi:hypothetical protein